MFNSSEEYKLWKSELAVRNSLEANLSSTCSIIFTLFLHPVLLRLRSSCIFRPKAPIYYNMIVDSTCKQQNRKMIIYIAEITTAICRLLGLEPPCDVITKRLEESEYLCLLRYSCQLCSSSALREWFWNQCGLASISLPCIYLFFPFCADAESWSSYRWESFVFFLVFWPVWWELYFLSSTLHIEHDREKLSLFCLRLQLIWPYPQFHSQLQPIPLFYFKAQGKLESLPARLQAWIQSHWEWACRSCVVHFRLSLLIGGRGLDVSEFLRRETPNTSIRNY